MFRVQYPLINVHSLNHLTRDLLTQECTLDHKWDLSIIQSLSSNCGVLGSLGHKEVNVKPLALNP